MNDKSYIILLTGLAIIFAISLVTVISILILLLIAFFSGTLTVINYWLYLGILIFAIIILSISVYYLILFLESNEDIQLMMEELERMLEEYKANNKKK